MISPPKVYEVNGQVCKLLSAFNVLVPGTNYSVVSAITGSIIRVMGVTVQHTGNFHDVSAIFKNGSGGTNLIGAAVPSQTLGLFWQEPVIDSGYCETSISTGLFVDIGGPGNVLYNVYYIIYTP